MGLGGAFGLNAVLAAVAAVAVVAGALTGGWRSRASGTRAALRAAARWAVPGGLAIVLAGTAVPRGWPPVLARGDLVLAPGAGGLGNLDQIVRAPTDLAAVELAGNIGMYALLAGAAAWGTGAALRVFLGCTLLSVLVELGQYVALDRVAATDDVLLNAAGALIGCLGASAFSRRFPERSSWRWSRPEQP